MRLFQDLKLLIPLIKDYWKGTYRDVSTKSIVIIVVALAYLISPIDLIPDYIIGLGQIDDAVILGLSLYFLEKDLMKYKQIGRTGMDSGKIVGGQNLFHNDLN